MELLEQMVTPGLIFEEPPRLFSTAEEQFYIPATCAQKLQFLHKCSWPAFFFFFNNSCFNGCEKWCLMVVLICASLVISGVERLFIIYPYDKENSSQDR